MVPIKRYIWRTCLLLAIVTTRAAAVCPPSDFNFFPNSTINQPGGWTKANQTAAGNNCDGHLLPIATYGFPKPLLNFQPSHGLLIAGAAVPSRYAVGYALLQLALQHAADNHSSSNNSSAESSNITVSSASKGSSSTRSLQRPLLAKAELSRPAFRKLMFENITTSANDTVSNSTNTTDTTNTTIDLDTGNWTVSVPAQYNITVTANGRPWYTSGPYNVSNGDIPAVNFEANVSQGRRDLFDPVIFKEGINTVVITVTLLQGTGAVTNGTTEVPAPFADEGFDSPPIDFYFFMSSADHDSRPKADVKLHSCSPDVTIEFKHTEPQPVSIDGYRLTYTPTNSSQALFLPTYYVYGSFVQGLDGSTGLDTDGTDGNVKNFGLYVTRKPGAPTDFTVASDQLNSLKEGWYNYTVEGSIWGPNPAFDSLLSVSGADVYSQKDASYVTIQTDGTPAADPYLLYNGFKGAGWVLPAYDWARVGIQKFQTWLQIFQGPDTALTLGSKATFEWDFTGLGNTSCEINGVNTNPLTGICTSPLVYTIATTLNQTLVVKFTDVCAVTHTAAMTFGPFGWEVDSGSQYELGSGILAPATGDGSLLKNSAGGHRSRVFVQMLGSLVAVWFMVLLL